MVKILNINKNVNIPVVLFEELSVKRLLSVFEEENEIVFIIKYDGKFVGGITQGDFKRALKNGIINVLEIINTKLVLEKLKGEYFGKKILIVDDNKLNIKVAKKSLVDFGFIIDEAVNGEEAINLVKMGKNYDLILMDIMMPVMSGETAIKELMCLDDFSTPVVALTADAVAGAEEKYTSEGFADYISKPFTKEQIKVKLDKIIFSDNNLKYNPNVDRFDGVEAIVIGGEDN